MEERRIDLAKRLWRNREEGMKRERTRERERERERARARARERGREREREREIREMILLHCLYLSTIYQPT